MRRSTMRPLAKLCVRRVDESAFLCRKNISGGVNGGSSFRGSIPTRVVVQKHGCHSNPSNRIEQRRRSSRQSLNAATYLMATPVDKLIIRIELNERHVRLTRFLLLLLEKGIDPAFRIRLNGLHGTASVNNHRDVCQICPHESRPLRSSNGGKQIAHPCCIRSTFIPAPVATTEHHAESSSNWQSTETQRSTERFGSKYCTVRK